MAREHEEIRALVDELVAIRREYALLTSDETPSEKLGPPASEQALRSLEARIGRRLPPSYRAFLELHDGWGDFSGNAKILAVEDQSSDWVRRRLDEIDGDFREFGGDNPVAAGGLPVYMGVTEPDYLFLDVRSGPPDGECELGEFDLTERVDAHPSFAAYLQSQVTLMKRMVEKERFGK